MEESKSGGSIHPLRQLSETIQDIDTAIKRLQWEGKSREKITEWFELSQKEDSERSEILENSPTLSTINDKLSGLFNELGDLVNGTGVSINPLDLAQEYPNALNIAFDNPLIYQQITRKLPAVKKMDWIRAYAKHQREKVEVVVEEVVEEDCPLAVLPQNLNLPPTCFSALDSEQVDVNTMYKVCGNILLFIPSSNSLVCTTLELIQKTIENDESVRFRCTSNRAFFTDMPEDELGYRPPDPCPSGCESKAVVSVAEAMEARDPRTDNPRPFELDRGKWDTVAYAPFAEGAGLGENSFIPVVQLRAVIQAAQQATEGDQEVSRLFILDYGGTIPFTTTKRNAERPSGESLVSSSHCQYGSTISVFFVRELYDMFADYLIQTKSPDEIEKFINWYPDIPLPGFIYTREFVDVNRRESILSPILSPEELEILNSIVADEDSKENEREEESKEGTPSLRPRRLFQDALPPPPGLGERQSTISQPPLNALLQRVRNSEWEGGVDNLNEAIAAGHVATRGRASLRRAEADTLSQYDVADEEDFGSPMPLESPTGSTPSDGGDYFAGAFAAAEPTDINLQLINGQTQLTDAILNGNLEMARTLLDSGADVNTVNRDNKTPLALAIRTYPRRMMGEMVELLLSHGADLRLGSWCYGQNALDCAAYTGEERVVLLLLETGSFTRLDILYAINVVITRRGYVPTMPLLGMLARAAEQKRELTLEQPPTLDDLNFRARQIVEWAINTGHDPALTGRTPSEALTDTDGMPREYVLWLDYHPEYKEIMYEVWLRGLAEM